MFAFLYDAGTVSVFFLTEHSTTVTVEMLIYGYR